MVPSGPQAPPSRRASAALSQMEWGRSFCYINRLEFCRAQERQSIDCQETKKRTTHLPYPEAFLLRGRLAGEPKELHRLQRLENVRPAKLWECCR